MNIGMELIKNLKRIYFIGANRKVFGWANATLIAKRGCVYIIFPIRNCKFPIYYRESQFTIENLI